MSEALEDPTPLLPSRVRGGLLGLIGLLLVAGIFLPNVAVRADPPGLRLLPTTANYFLGVTLNQLPGADPATVGFGLTVTFLGLSGWQLGLVLLLLTVWTLGPAEQHRWLWTIVLIGSVLVALGPPTVIAGAFFLDAARAPTTLGIAWLPTFVGGLALVIWTVHANRLIDRSWYPTRTELIT